MQLDTSVQIPLNKLFPKCLGDIDIKENHESKGNGAENFFYNSVIWDTSDSTR